MLPFCCDQILRVFHLPVKSSFTSNSSSSSSSPKVMSLEGLTTAEFGLAVLTAFGLAALGNFAALQHHCKDKQVYIPKPKNPKLTAKDHPAKDDTCHNCKEVGHWKRNCPVYLAELLKKKNQVGTASSSGIFTIELFAFPNKSWVYATGCGTHICITKQGFREAKKVKQGALYLYVGNGVHAQVEAIMTGKSFPRRPERVTSLLGIIHTDVCGPLRHVSRQGASYFITFTDDYSRYGYVYLLKHKHEVFETFKVFKNKVENQLGKTIKAFRSDRGGEYISQEFKDYLKACGIVQQLTP
ncbi:retrotransposon protein, putative, ty1-copia subclass [Tanacetum coccineum]